MGSALYAPELAERTRPHRKPTNNRPVQHLNNILEQDHRAIKKRIRAKQHFREVSCARRTIQGYETMHKIRKGQVRRVTKGDIRVQNRFIDQVFGLAA
jgi:transposase, IS6 family